MNWNWPAIYDAFATFGPRVLFCAIVLVGIYSVGVLMKAYAASRKKAPEKSPEAKFLEGAMDEDAPRKPTPGYTYADFKRDLYDRGLTFNEIYEKCGGVFPQKPKEPETKAEEAQKPPEGPGSKSDDPDRLSKLEAWFLEAGKNRFKGLVRPPPNPYPVIHKIYIRGRR
jgi:hypothetical protein